jgi:hypothetical protein
VLFQFPTFIEVVGWCIVVVGWFIVVMRWFIVVVGWFIEFVGWHASAPAMAHWRTNSRMPAPRT